MYSQKFLHLLILLVLLSSCAVAPISLQTNPDRDTLEPIAQRAFTAVSHITQVSRNKDGSASPYKSDNYFPYIDGEKFVRYAIDNHGKEVLQQLFTEPPQNPWQIVQPQRYFETQNDAGKFDFDAGVRHLAGEFPRDQWLSIRSSLLPRELQNFFAPIAHSPRAAERYTENHVQDAVVFLEKRDRVDALSTSIVLAEIDTERHARATHANVKRTVRAATENLLAAAKNPDYEGVRLIDKEYQIINRGDDEGFFRSARFAYNNAEFELSTLYIRRNRAIASITTRNDALTTDDMYRILSGALRASGVEP